MVSTSCDTATSDIPTSAPAILGLRAEVRTASSPLGVRLHWAGGGGWPSPPLCSIKSSLHAASPTPDFTGDFASNFIENLENGYVE